MDRGLGGRRGERRGRCGKEDHWWWRWWGKRCRRGLGRSLGCRSCRRRSCRGASLWLGRPEFGGRETNWMERGRSWWVGKANRAMVVDFTCNVTEATVYSTSISCCKGVNLVSVTHSLRCIITLAPRAQFWCLCKRSIRLKRAVAG